jgi:hypothetical protein
MTGIMTHPRDQSPQIIVTVKGHKCNPTPTPKRWDFLSFLRNAAITITTKQK